MVDSLLKEIVRGKWVPVSSYWKTWVFLFFLASHFVLTNPSYAQEYVELKEVQNQEYSLGHLLLIKEDITKSISIDSLANDLGRQDFDKYDPSTPLKSFTNYWFSFHVKNNTGYDQHLILDLNKSVDVISTEIYMLDESEIKPIGVVHKKINHQQLGNQVGRGDTLHFHIPNGKVCEVIINLNSNYDINPKPDFRLFTTTGWQSNISHQNLIQGVFQGLVVMLMIASLFLFFSVRDYTFLLYFGTVLFSSFYFLQSYDFLGSHPFFEFLWTPSLYLSITFNFLFVRRFIHDAGVFKKFEKALLMAAWFTGLNAVIYTIVYFISYYLLLQFNNYFLFLYLAFNFLVFLLLLGIRNRPVRILVIGSLIYSIACILSISSTIIDKKDMLQSGFLIQQIVFALAMSEKIRLDRKKANLILEDKVQERTKELAAKQEKIELQNNELQEFAYITSHDLKAPLRGIGTIAAWLESDFYDKFDDAGKENMRLLINRAKKMELLIDDILNYSKIGRKQEPVVAIDLQDMIDESIELLDIPDFIRVVSENKLPVIQGRKTQLRQVLQNLISNSIKYMDKDEGTIQIGASLENDHVKVWVRDNGQGIDKKYFNKIFKMFQTLSNEETYESTGVGLAIVKKIIELNKGEVWIESEVGIGTNVIFTLPQSNDSLEKSKSEYKAEL